MRSLSAETRSGLTDAQTNCGRGAPSVARIMLDRAIESADSIIVDLHVRNGEYNHTSTYYGFREPGGRINFSEIKLHDFVIASAEPPPLR